MFTLIINWYIGEKYLYFKIKRLSMLYSETSLIFCSEMPGAIFIEVDVNEIYRKIVDGLIIEMVLITGVSFRPLLLPIIVV